MIGMKRVHIGAACLVLAASACSLEVANQNAPDRDRAIQEVAGAEGLISGSYNTWFNGVYSYYGPGMFLSNQAFQGTAVSANSGMEFYGRLPREAIVNDPADKPYINFSSPWYASYRAIAGAADGLRASARPDVGPRITSSDLARDKAFAYFVLGLGHATIALLYDKGFVVDEATTLTEPSGAPVPQPARPYGEVMSAAQGYFDKALSFTAGATFTIPPDWIATDAALTAPEFARVIHSVKARYLVAVARAPAERAAIDWRKVIGEVDAGITSSFVQNMDDNHGWPNEAYWYGSSWSQTGYFVWGMADQSGNYQLWLNTPLADRQPMLGGKDLLIITPDQRFPQGSTLADQVADEGRYLINGGRTGWNQPDRGKWRWSYYTYNRRPDFITKSDFHLEEIPISEMNLLKAEGLYRQGDRAGAAALVNISRVGIGGLEPTDAAGTNTSCVPKLGDGSCGDLFEMIKWEKRVEGAFQGLFAAPWFFDSRGWGDLYKGTPLQFPIPCLELQVLQMLPCYTFGGSSQPSAAAGSTYGYPGEA